MLGKRIVNPFMKSTIIYLLSTLFGQGMSFLGIIVFTRLMKQADYGNYTTYYAYVSIFTVLVGANLYYALNNAYIDKGERIKEFRRSVCILSVIIATTVSLIVLISGSFIAGRISAFIVTMGALHSYGFFLVNYRIYAANMENDYRKKGMLLIFPNSLQFAFSLVLILCFPHNGFGARVIGSAVGVAVVGAAVFIGIMRDKGNPVHLDDWKYALSIALPTVVMSLSYMLMQQCDKVMITTICSSGDTAIYSVIYYLGYALIAVDQAIAPVRQAWIFRRLDAKDTSEAKLIQKWYLFIMMGLATGITLAGPEIVKVLAPVKYWRYEYIAPFVLSACLMLLYRFHTEIILFYKKNAALSLSVLICALINIILNAVMIPEYGALAACYTTVIAYGLLFIITGIISNKCVRPIYSAQYFLTFIGWIVMISLISNILSRYLVFRYAVLLITSILLFFYAKYSKKEWKKIFET